MDAVLELARVAIMRHWGGGRGEAPVRENAPVKGAGEDEVLVRAEFGEAFAEISLEDEPASFIYYEESKDNPRTKSELFKDDSVPQAEVWYGHLEGCQPRGSTAQERNSWLQRLIDVVMEDRQAGSYKDHEGRIIIEIVVYFVV